MKTEEIRCSHKRHRRAGAEEIQCNRFLLVMSPYEILARCPVCSGLTRIRINQFGHIEVEAVGDETHQVLKMKDTQNG